MQNTPFRDIQHHQDGRHIFTVKAGEEVKRFGTTDTIDAAKALRNALSWRNGNLGGAITPTEEATIGRFVRELETPTNVDKPVKLVKKIEVTKPAHVKVQQLPFGVRRTNENTIAKAVKQGRNKATDEDRRKSCERMVDEKNKRRPSLPVGVAVMTMRDGAVGFVANYYMDGQRFARNFRVGKPNAFSLAKYRMIRHIAISFRKEYLNSEIEKRPMNLDAFVNPRKQVLNGTFPWPFKGRLPARTKPRPRNGMTREEFALVRLQSKSAKYPALPIGVAPAILKKNTPKPQLAFQVQYRKGDMNVVKTFYVGYLGEITLAKYRLCRFAALRFREEYVASRLEDRPLRVELFENWRDKVERGEFAWKYKWTLPPYTPTTTVASRLESRAGRVATDIFNLLGGYPEFAAVLSVMEAERAEQLTARVIEVINDELYNKNRNK